MKLINKLNLESKRIKCTSMMILMMPRLCRHCDSSNVKVNNDDDDNVKVDNDDNNYANVYNDNDDVKVDSSKISPRNEEVFGAIFFRDWTAIGGRTRKFVVLRRSPNSISYDWLQMISVRKLG